MQESAARVREQSFAIVQGWDRDVLSALVVSLISLAYSLSFALLIFSGPLSPGLHFGISAALLSAGVCTIVVSIGSSYKRAVAGPDSAPTAIMAGLAATVGAHVALPDAQIQTVLAALVTAAFASGLFLLILGALRLEAWMRYIPYPVLAGFVAAVGWQLTVGGVHVVTGEALTLGNLDAFVRDDTAYHLAAGLAFAGAAALAQYATRSPLAFAGVLLGAIVLAHAIFLLDGMTLEQARTGQWLLAAPEELGVFLPWQHRDVIDWQAVIGGAGEILACAAIVAINVLLNGTSLELWSRRSLDLNRELIVNGCANILAGAAGGLPGNLSFNRTILNTRTGATGRRAGVVAGVMLLALVAVGPGIMGVIPTPVLGGVLLYLGLHVLWDTFSRARHTLGLADYALLTFLFVLIVNRGYFEGVALGVVISCIGFVIRYSRIDIVRHDLTRRSFASTVDRTERANELLRDAGGELHILWLRGYLFFGTANRFYIAIERRVTGADPLRHLVIDFSRVSGIDSSAIFSFVKLAHFARDRGVTIALCKLAPDALAAFRGEGLLHSGDRYMRSFPTLDEGLEWSEEAMLDARDKTRGGADVPVEIWLSKELDDRDLAARLVAALESVTLPKDGVLFAQGDAADALYLVESGRLAIVMKAEDGTTLRLRTMATHTILGEMGLYRDLDRTASVIALEPSRALRLTKAKFLALRTQDPDLCDAVHRMVVRTLANRLAFANSTVAALQ